MPLEDAACDTSHPGGPELGPFCQPVKRTTPALSLEDWQAGRRGHVAPGDAERAGEALRGGKQQSGRGTRKEPLEGGGEEQTDGRKQEKAHSYSGSCEQCPGDGAEAWLESCTHGHRRTRA